MRAAHCGSYCEAEAGREGKEEQRLSSQNPKLKRTKERENSGGQKVDTEAAIGRGKVRPKKRREAKRKRRAERGKGEPEEAAAEIEAGGRRKEIADEAIRGTACVEAERLTPPLNDSGNKNRDSLD